MTKIRQLEELRATIAQYTDMNLHDKARELSRQLPALEQEAEAERRALRAAQSPLAALGDAVAAAPSPGAAFQDAATTPERLARRAELSPMLGAADALRERQIRERQGR